MCKLSLRDIFVPPKMIQREWVASAATGTQTDVLGVEEKCIFHAPGGIPSPRATASTRSLAKGRHREGSGAPEDRNSVGSARKGCSDISTRSPGTLEIASSHCFEGVETEVQTQEGTPHAGKGD